tara:strand:+ start:79 stop:588 length:510 start_codon:yes stop_codon:yes gene_type:complete
MDYNEINKLDRYFEFLKKGQKRWERKEKIDYSQLNKKKMNSMQKWREDNPPFEKSENPKLYGKYILKKGVKFFNGDLMEPEFLTQEINEFLQNEWILELRNVKISISDAREIQKYTTLEISKIEHNSTEITEIKENHKLCGSVMISYSITCNMFYFDKIKKYYDYDSQK